jgi:uncharacterized protein (TIGR04255 family)
VGLRYINKIDRRSPDERIGTWLKATDVIPAAILSSAPGSLLRLEARRDVENRIVVTIGDPPTSGAAVVTSVIFDIDRIVERDIDVRVESLEQQMNRLHDDVWHIFATAKTEQLDRLLSERGK